MPFLRLAAAHLDIVFAVLVIIFQSIALLTRGKNHLSSPQGWLDLVIWAFSLFAVILGGRSALDTARILSNLKHEAEQTLKVSQEAQNSSKHALLNSRTASDKSEQASTRADSAETDAVSAQKLSKKAEEGALNSLRLSNAAEAELAAQRRALRSVRINLDLSGPVQSGHQTIFSSGDNKDFPSVYLYSVAANAKDSDGFKLAGRVSTGTRGNRWDASLQTELINKGFPVGEDIRTLSAYRDVCVDLIAQLGAVGLAVPPSAISSPDERSSHRGSKREEHATTGIILCAVYLSPPFHG